MEGKARLRAPVIAGAMFVVAALGVIIGDSTRAAYSDLSPNRSNGFSAGSVAVGDNDAGDLMLSMVDAKPGASSTACIKVTYSGSLASTLRMYGSTTGTGLAPFLTLTVTRGGFTTSEPQFASCTNFVPDAADHIGRGSGVVYQGSLADFPDDYASGIVDPATAAPEEWMPGDSHVYRFNVSLRDDVAAQGKTSTQTFTWEARNS